MSPRESPLPGASRISTFVNIRFSTVFPGLSGWEVGVHADISSADAISFIGFILQTYEIMP
jgi:hypothetical protein